eukprot:7476064-Karenia_brevis.AAC.1
MCIRDRVKFAESVGIDGCIEDVRRAFEPGQVGICTPDGNIVLLRALQSWSKDMEEDNLDKIARHEYADLEGTLGVDFTNAYGKYFRSAAIHGILKR